MPTAPPCHWKHHEKEKRVQVGKRGAGGQFEEKGSSITTDKRRRKMICREEKDRGSWDSERKLVSKIRKSTGEKQNGRGERKRGEGEGEVSEGHSRNKHI